MVKPLKGVDKARLEYLTVDEARRLVNVCDCNFRPLVQERFTLARGMANWRNSSCLGSIPMWEPCACGDERAMETKRNMTSHGPRLRVFQGDVPRMPRRRIDLLERRA
jgi:hypothetical protein